MDGRVLERLRSVVPVKPDQALVQLFGVRGREMEALRDLARGVTATYLRTAVLGESAFSAVVEGLNDRNPRVRWWCVQTLDHVPDRRAVAAVAELLDDPVARVRRNAAHALGCIACKPEWNGVLPAAATAKLTQLAARDTSAK